MSLSIEPRSAALKDLEALKRHFKSKGYATKVILDDKTMERVSALVTGDKRYILTPPDELRYMEGLLDLPMGYMKEFGIVPAEGYEACGCGRTPSALDVVLTALKQGIHGKALVRDTLLGMENVFEIADAGREAVCVSCGKPIRVERYHYKRSYFVRVSYLPGFSLTTRSTRTRDLARRLACALGSKLVDDTGDEWLTRSFPLSGR